MNKSKSLISDTKQDLQDTNKFLHLLSSNFYSSKLNQENLIGQFHKINRLQFNNFKSKLMRSQIKLKNKIDVYLQSINHRQYQSFTQSPMTMQNEMEIGGSVYSQYGVNHFIDKISNGDRLLFDTSCLWSNQHVDKNMFHHLKYKNQIPHIGITKQESMSDDRILKIGCGILNYGGGYIIIGINALYKYQIQGFTLQNTYKDRVNDIMQTLKICIQPNFQCKQKLMPIKNTEQCSQNKFCLVVSLFPLNKKKLFYIKKCKMAENIQYMMTQLKKPDEDTVRCSTIHASEIYNSIHKAYTNQNRYKNYEIDHYFRKSDKQIPQLKYQQAYQPIKNQIKEQKKCFRRTMTFFSLLAVNSRIKVKILEQFQAKMKKQNRQCLFSTPFTNLLKNNGEDGRIFWLFEHQDKFPFIRQILNKFDKAGNITMYTVHQQIQFFPEQLQPKQLQIFVDNMLKLYPQEVQAAKYLIKTISSQNIEKDMYRIIRFKCKQASAFFFTWMESYAIRPTFIYPKTSHKISHKKF